MMESTFILLVIIISLLQSLNFIIVSCSSLMCNYCYRADSKADCHLNAMRCPYEHVCFVERNLVLYAFRKSYTQYRMGCEHFSVCQDRISHGERPYGYTVSNKTCCCSSYCEQPDGVGRRVYGNCPVTWGNYTVNNASQNRSYLYFIVMLTSIALLWNERHKYDTL